MFTRNSAIVVGAVLATSLAVIGGNMAERHVLTQEQWKYAVARIPPEEAGPPGATPAVQEQPKVDTFEPNPFAGQRRFGKLVPGKEHTERLEKVRVRSKLFENLSGLAFLLAKAIPLLALFLLWQGRRNKQESNIESSPVEGVSHEQLQTDSRCSVPDGEATAADDEGLPDPTVRINPVHTAIFAPTRVGKGTSFVVPFLRECQDSCFVLDYKGELALLTAAIRREMGHDVRIIDPLHLVTQTPDRLNMLDGIRKDSRIAIDECRDAAAELVIKTGQEKEPHWVESAETWISTMLAAVAWFGETGNRSLQTVRTLLSNPQKMQAIIRLICRTPDAWDGMLARMGQQLMRYQGEELGSTLTTTNRFLKFLDTIAIAESTGKESTFDPADMPKRKMTIYYVMSPEHATAQQGFTRLMVGSVLRAVVKNGLQETNLVHFVLDEAATLGPNMKCVQDALDKYAGYGVRCQFYYQSMGQLKECWPDGKYQTFLSNVTQVFFGVNDNETARYVSDRLGDATIVLESGNDTRGTTYQQDHAGKGSSSESYQNTYSWAPKERRLLQASEVLNLSPRVAITFTPGVRPIWTTLTRYYEEKPGSAVNSFREKASIIARCVGVLVYALAISACVVMFANQKVNHVRIHGHHHVSR